MGVADERPAGGGGKRIIAHRSGRTGASVVVVCVIGDVLLDFFRKLIMNIGQKTGLFMIVGIQFTHFNTLRRIFGAPPLFVQRERSVRLWCCP